MYDIYIYKGVLKKMWSPPPSQKKNHTSHTQLTSTYRPNSQLSTRLFYFTHGMQKSGPSLSAGHSVAPVFWGHSLKSAGGKSNIPRTFRRNSVNFRLERKYQILKCWQNLEWKWMKYWQKAVYLGPLESTTRGQGGLEWKQLIGWKWSLFAQVY